MCSGLVGGWAVPEVRLVCYQFPTSCYPDAIIMSDNEDLGRDDDPNDHSNRGDIAMIKADNFRLNYLPI